MLVLAFGPFAFVEIVTLGFSWAWAVWGWRMLHISVPAAAQGQWRSWELWAHLSTLSTTILVGILAPPGFPCWAAQLPQFVGILWPRGLSTVNSPTESQTWGRAATRESQHSLCFPYFGLFYLGRLGMMGMTDNYTFSLAVIDLKSPSVSLLPQSGSLLKPSLNSHWVQWWRGTDIDIFSPVVIEMKVLGFSK